MPLTRLFPNLVLVLASLSIACEPTYLVFSTSARELGDEEIGGTSGADTNASASGATSVGNAGASDTSKGGARATAGAGAAGAGNGGSESAGTAGSVGIAGSAGDAGDNGNAGTAGFAGDDSRCTNDENCHPAQFRAHAYWFVVEARDWGSAADYCTAAGYHLVTIDDAEENEWVATAMREYASNLCWIGFHDPEQNGDWVWQDGSSSAYTNWNSGEPNNIGGNERCTELILFLSPSTWNDGACGELRPFVCEQ